MAPTWTVWQTAPLPRPSAGWEFPIFWASLPLIGILLLGALVLYFVDRWRKRATLPSSPAGDELTQYRLLYERGQMSREEFERVKALLSGRMRKELNVPAPGGPEQAIQAAPPAMPPQAIQPPGTLPGAGQSPEPGPSSL